MPSFEEHIDALSRDADACDAIGRLTTEPTKRASFRILAQQFRALAIELGAEVDGIKPPPIDRTFLFEQAKRCRDLAAETADAKLSAALQKLASEFETKVGQQFA